MREVWESGGFWFFQAAQVPKGMYNIFSTHVKSRFNKEHEGKVFDDVLFWYWGIRAQETIDKKLEDREAYRAKVREAFAVE